MVNMDEKVWLPQEIKESVEDFLTENMACFDAMIQDDMKEAIEDTVRNWCENAEIPFRVVDFNAEIVISLEMKEGADEPPEVI